MAKSYMDEVNALASYKPEYQAKIDAMSEAELDEFLGGEGSPKICTVDGCYREPARGYIECLQCLHGQSDRAADEYVAAKKRLARLRRKSGRA